MDLLEPGGGATAEIVARRRKGASLGELAALLDERYSQTALASIPTSVLELDARELVDLAAGFPRILTNALRTTHARLARARERSLDRPRGETVALAAGPALGGEVARLVAAAKSATAGSVRSLDRGFSFAGALTAADDLIAAHSTVLLAAELDPEPLGALLREADRVVAFIADAREAALLGPLSRGGEPRGQVEAVLVGVEPSEVRGMWAPDAPLEVVRVCQPGKDRLFSDEDVAWLARHLTRTKLGVALGAGGAKGYAHVGVLQVLEEAGFVVDYVAGSSIGAIVGAYLALGRSAAEIDATLRRAFNADAVAEIFKTSLAGRGGGLEVMTQLLRETTAERTFADTAIPLTIMAVDLVGRAPAPLRDGPLWEALLAATALAGVFPPVERDGKRLVDGLALVPVPTGELVQAGADVTVAVNLISSERLSSWPSGPPPEPPLAGRRRGVLDNLLEVMDLSQLAESMRHAELADVVVTPRFGPGEWRDFDLADMYLAAGRVAAEEQLPALKRLSTPAG